MAKNWYSIKAKGNREAEVFIYDEIGLWGITSKQFAIDLRALGDLSKIHLHINSPGGSVTDGIAIYNLLKQSSAEVTTYIDGAAWSMGSVIALAGDRVLMAENASYMIHNPMSGVYGDAEAMRDWADVMDKFKSSLLSAYRRTGKSDEELADLMDAETWFSADEALEAGFVDEVTGAVELAAHFDASRFANAPQAILKPPATDAGNQHNEGDDSMPEPANNPKPPKASGNQPPAAPDEGAIEAARKEGAKAELKRQAAISAVFEPFGNKYNAISAELIANPDADAAVAREKLLEAMGKNGQPLGGTARIIKDEGEKFIMGVGLSIQSRAGLLTRDEQVANRGNEYRGYSMTEIARACLERGGVSTAGMSRMAMVGKAFAHGTSDFPNVLTTAIEKSLLKGFDEAAETFEQWTTRGELSDFKPTRRVDLGLMSALEVIGEDGEYNYGTVGDRGENIALATYGKMFRLTRQAIINDDLDVFGRIPTRMGSAAKRTIGNLVYAVLTSNPKMDDGTALFHADHKNLLTGGASALGVDSLDTSRSNMAKQQLDKETINVRPSYLLVPVAMEGKARQLMNSTAEPGQDNPNVGNRVASMAEVISDARLDVASLVSWYLAANGQQFDTVEVAYLDGVDSPYLEEKETWSVDGVEWKVRLDAGVAPLAFQTLYKAAGS